MLEQLIDCNAVKYSKACICPTNLPMICPAVFAGQFPHFCMNRKLYFFGLPIFFGASQQPTVGSAALQLGARDNASKQTDQILPVVPRLISYLVSYLMPECLHLLNGVQMNGIASICGQARRPGIQTYEHLAVPPTLTFQGQQREQWLQNGLAELLAGSEGSGLKFALLE